MVAELGFDRGIFCVFNFLAPDDRIAQQLDGASLTSYEDKHFWLRQ